MVCSLFCFTYKAFRCFFLCKWRSKQDFWVFGRRTQNRRQFLKEGVGRANQPRVKLWYRGNKVLIYKVFHLTHKQNIKKTREAITPIADTAELCASKYSIESSYEQRKKWSRNWKSDLTNLGSLVELLYLRVERENRNVENHLQNAPWIPHVLLFQFNFFLFLYFTANCNIN